MGPESRDGAPLARPKHYPMGPRRREGRPVGELHSVERVRPLAGGGEGKGYHLFLSVPGQNMEGLGDTVDPAVDILHRVIDQGLPGKATIPPSHHQRIDSRPQRVKRRPLGCPLLDGAAPGASVVGPRGDHLDARTGPAVRRPRAERCKGVLLPPEIRRDQVLGDAPNLPALSAAELKVDGARLPVEVAHVDRGEVKAHRAEGSGRQALPRAALRGLRSASRRPSSCGRSPRGRSLASGRGRRGRGWR